MARDVERRLKLLERKLPATDGGELNRLLGLARNGQLHTVDLDQLSDEQVWWLVAQEPTVVKPR